MGATAAAHPADPILQAYGLGKLDDVSSRTVSKHLERCNSCQRRIAELSSDEFLGRLQQAKVMPDKGALEWSPSAELSGDGGSGPFVPPAPAGTLPPELVDHPDYEIVRELGRGGMGVVYLAQNKLMGRPEVLKVVGRHLIERSGVADRFLREIRSAAMLHHANIVAAYTAMRFGQSLVLAMEYVDGSDLAAKVEDQGPLPVAHACYFIYQVALGLQHAHERGMVHRDIKPANLMLARDGKKAIVKVLDFGLAKVTSEGQTDSNLTREGQMLGTPHYIAPEQIRNAQSADIRADIYSLGCTLYYLLTGGPPFRGDHLWDVYQAHFSMEAGPLNLIRPEVPVELAAVVAKMMAKEPGRRFQTPADVARTLTPFFKTGSVASTTPNPEPSTSWPTQSARSVTPATVAPPARAEEATRPESNWKSLIELKDAGRLIGDAPEVREAVGAPRAVWAMTAGAIVLLGSIAGWVGYSLHSSTPVAVRENGTPPVEPVRRDRPIVAKDAHAFESQEQISPPIPSSPSSSAASADNTRKSSPPPSAASADNTAKSRSPRSATNLPDAPEAAPQLDARKPMTTLARPSKPVTPPREHPSGIVDFRQLVAVPGLKRLTDPGAERPLEVFWPSLAPENLTDWQFADPAHVRMKQDGVSVEAGPHGNFLVTRDASYRKCMLSITLAAKPGTDAFLALRARRGAGGWRAITSRVNEQKGKVHAGHQSIDFQTEEIGSGRRAFDAKKMFLMKFQIDDNDVARVSVKSEKTSSTTLARPPAVETAGAVGVFVKSGTVVIRTMEVQED